MSDPPFFKFENDASKMTHLASQEVQSPLVVGVGASAGGLEAFQALVTALGPLRQVLAARSLVSQHPSVC